MSECEDAKADLSNAEDRLKSTAAWVRSAIGAVEEAEGKYAEAKYEHRRGIVSAEGFEGASSEAAAGVVRAEEALAAGEQKFRNGDEDVDLGALRQALRFAELDSRTANERSKGEWARVAELAIAEERALTGVTTAKNKLSLAEEDQSKAEAWVAEAAKAVARACS